VHDDLLRELSILSTRLTDALTDEENEFAVELAIELEARLVVALQASEFPAAA